MKSLTAISFLCDLPKVHLEKWRLTQKPIPLQKSFKNAFYNFSSWKKSPRFLHTIHFSKLYDVQKSQTKALFTYFTKYTFLQSNMSLSCFLVTAQRRLPEYPPPFAAHCFTMYIHEKCYGLGTSSIWNVTWKKCHQSWHWSVVGKKSRCAWFGRVCKCSVRNLKAQGGTAWTNIAGIIRLFPQL